MGCDIHAHMEVKINGQWHHAHMPPIRRSYDLFARMAGVRNANKGPGYIEPIAQPRGLPEDATFITNFHSDYMGSDGHSHSWLNCEELSSLIEWYDAKRKEREPGKYVSPWEYETLGYLFGNGWDVKKYPSDFPAGVEDTRIVFWFDN
jgi:hypothetical protein